MSESRFLQLSPKQRFVRASIAFVLGGIASLLLFVIGVAFIGAGHGLSTMLVISGGVGGLSFFVFPLACAGVASQQPKAMWAGLMWECFHHAASFFGPDSVLSLPEAADFLNGHHSTDLFVVWLCVYVIAHLSVPMVFWFNWRKGNRRMS